MSTSLKNRIIIYSPDSLMSNYLRSFVSHLGQTVLTPSSGGEFVRFLNIHGGEISLIIYDIEQVNSEVLLHIEAMKRLSQSVAVVPLSGPGQSSLRDDIGRTTPWKVVRKPFLPQDIKVSIVSAISALQGLSLSPRDVVGNGGSSSREQNYHPQLLLGTSRAMDGVKTVIDHVANTDVTILIRGESGTGKELAAKTLFECSNRSGKPFVTVLCPAIPDPLLESELFGYEKGSFTGAFRRRPGKFEIANKGTIFLDEIGDIPFELQSKLLHVLQGGEFARIGGSDQKVDARILAATNKDLEKGVADGTFREDLYYRLNVVSIFLPPLRERREDIPLLVDRFLDKFNSQFNKQYSNLSSRTLDCFMQYNWPGNIRELENLVKRIVIMGDEATILQQHLKRSNQKHLNPGKVFPGQQEEYKAEEPEKPAPGNGQEFPSLKQVGKEAMLKAEGEAIQQALDATRWNRKAAARLLKISYKALLYKIKQCGLEGTSSGSRETGPISSASKL